MIKTDTTKKVICKKITQTINAGAMKTHVKAELDGKTVIDEDGHSIVGNLVDFLYQGMSRSPSPANRTLCAITRICTISSVASTGGATPQLRLYIDQSLSITYVYDVLLYNMNIGGTPVAALNGISGKVTYHKGTSPYYINTDITWDEAYTGATGYCIPTQSSISLSPTSFSASAKSFNLLLGIDDTAVTVEDYAIQIVPISATDNAVSTVASDTSTNVASLVVSRTFTNATASAITVKEAGLFMAAPGVKVVNSTAHALVGRDVFSSPITIDVGASLALKYTISVEIDTDASGDQVGFLKTFLQMLSNHARGGDQAITGYAGATNLTPTSSTSYHLWAAYSLSRRFNRFYNAATEGWMIGILLGGSTSQTIGINDHELTELISEGDGLDGNEKPMLRYWASWVNEITSGTGYRQFEIKRLVENNSGVDILVGELGLAVSCYNESSSYYYYYPPEYPALLSRTVFAEANRFTIPAGYYCEVSYIIRVKV